MSYKVYLVISAGLPRDHHALFIETDPNTLSGHIYQVTGNVQNGMAFEDKPGEPPEQQPTFQGKKLIGTVPKENEKAFKDVCLGLEPPKKQFDGPKRLYPGEPIRRCQEWTTEAIRALVSSGVLLLMEGGNDTAGK
ncbi:hypothetical protein FQN55_001992 [Onygenales sp. PD_40]|nr:hypothetical protein FQN55_001992 [Onygenales sp. PD_40]KAK2794824.1 hypothetical protein FQN51_000647 [Onygenales sp. PD_10]KAK2795680.1 hypothetical protein FQN52_003529 [Onygenales sp. PD_12]